MKKLSQLGTQLLEIWKQLGLNQRISVIFTAVLVVGGLGSLAFWSNRSDFALLYGGLDPGEASKVAAALDESKVPYKAQAGGSIYVASDKVYAIRMQLAGKGLPAKGDGIGFEIFDKSNFGISDFVQRINFLRAVQGELARTIAQMDEIEAARVTVVVPENPLLGNNQRKPTASVFVKIRGRAELSSMAINSIRFLVANSVEGLQPNHVTVVDNRGNVLSPNTEEDSVVGLSSSQLAIRQNLEKYLSKQAESALNFFLGPGQAVVRVAAEVNYDTINRTEVKIDPDGSVPKSITIKDDKTVSATSAGGGVAGLIPNANAETNNTAGPVNNSNNSTKMTTTENEISKSTSTILQVPGSIKRLSAAVVIAMRMKGTGADRTTNPFTDAERKDIQKLVENAIGAQLAPDSGRTDEITLMEMELNDQGSLEITKQLDQQQKQEFWVGLVKNLVYPALAFAVLFGFYRSFKSTPAEHIPIGIPLGQYTALGLPPPGGNGNGNGNGHNGHTEEPGVVTVDVLNRLVRENPDNMGQAIREWLSRTKPGQKN
jgi:flagellar M-ring protein FliF